jgi:ABC-2 type transport system ATP-binding protein
VIATSRLMRRFGSRVVVNDVTLNVARGEIVALLGPNGAGKTTTLRMIAGLIAPTSGTVTVDGTIMSRSSGAALRRRIGFLTETPGLWDRLTVRENLTVYADLYGLDRAADRVAGSMNTFDLIGHAEARAAELSKGMRQKVALARALLHDPDVLLLDEPTSGLDPEVTRTVRTLLDQRRAAGCAILLSTHNLDEAARIADRVAVLHERLVAFDPPAILRRRLMSGRVVVRVAGESARFLHAAAGYEAEADGSSLMYRLTDPDRETAAIVRALVNAGAEIVEVRPEMPALEDVYLHLLGAERGRPTV